MPRLLIVSVAVVMTMLVGGCGSDEGAVDADAPVSGPAHAAAIAEAKGVWLENMAECLNGKGLDTIVIDGALSSTQNDSNASLDVLTLNDECQSELVDAGVLDPPAAPTEEYFSGAYDYNLTVKACLAEQGHETPDPPSREAYIEAQGANWSPYAEIDTAVLGVDGWDRLNELCPQDYLPY